MRLEKEFTIYEVSASNSANAAFQIRLARNPFERDSEPSITLDEHTSILYQILPSFDLVNRILVCSFESRDLSLTSPEHGFERMDTISVESNDLMIYSLKRTEETLRAFYTVPPSIYTGKMCTLELLSFGGSDDMHVHVLPSPFYRLTLDLTDEEYEACKQLSPTAVFRVEFHLAPLEKKA